MNEVADQSVQDEVIRPVVQVARAEAIMVLGSLALGQTGPQRDLNLLVVRAGFDALDLIGEVNLNLLGVGPAVDAIVAWPHDPVRCRDSYGIEFREALRDARVVYESAREV